MKKIFQSYAAYNRNVNRELLSILENLSREQLHAQTGAYYSSIYEALLHIFFSNDLFFLKLFQDISPNNKHLAKNRFVSLDENSYQQVMKELELDYKKFFQYRKEMDETIVQFIEDLSEDKFDSRVGSYNSTGEPVETELWIVLASLFNHQTHHRGQISAFLDQLGVENDYSTMI